MCVTNWRLHLNKQTRKYGRSNYFSCARISAYLNKEIEAKEILNWLISLDIVKSTPTDCVLSSTDGYAISNGAKLVMTGDSNLPFNLGANGFEISTCRQVFDTGQNGIEKLICPNCKEDISSEDWDFLSECADNKSNNLTCPLCKIATDIHSFQFTPIWGFSDLGFTFWNWSDLTEDFLNDFKQKLSCEINVVHTQI